MPTVVRTHTGTAVQGAVGLQYSVKTTLCPVRRRQGADAAGPAPRLDTRAGQESSACSQRLTTDTRDPAQTVERLARDRAKENTIAARV